MIKTGNRMNGLGADYSIFTGEQPTDIVVTNPWDDLYLSQYGYETTYAQPDETYIPTPGGLVAASTATPIADPSNIPTLTEAADAIGKLFKAANGVYYAYAKTASGQFVPRPVSGSSPFDIGKLALPIAIGFALVLALR